VGRFQSWRFQVDPTDPAPQRDLRWLLLVLGFCSLVVSVFLLALYALLAAAVPGIGFSCGSGSLSCTGTLVEYLFLVPGLVLLAAGALAIVFVMYELR